MSKRLQVLLDEAEFRDLQRVARRQRMTVAEWVRQTLRAARRAEGAGDPARKVTAVRRAVRYEFPTASIEEMLADIERGYADQTGR